MAVRPVEGRCPDRYHPAHLRAPCKRGAGLHIAERFKAPLHEGSTSSSSLSFPRLHAPRRRDIADVGFAAGGRDGSRTRGRC